MINCPFNSKTQISASQVFLLFYSLEFTRDIAEILIITPLLILEQFWSLVLQQL